MVYIPEFVIGLAIGFVLGVVAVFCVAAWWSKKKER